MREFWRRARDRYLERLTGLTPLSRLDAEDVVIVGYPKSGNTWAQYLAAGVLYGVDPAVAPDRLIQELVPDVHVKRFYRRYGTPMCFKSHHLPRPEYRRVVYLLRDGRDVMVSYFHHAQALAQGRVDFLRMVQEGQGLFLAKWHQHVEAWLQNPFRAEVLLLRYEDLLRQPAEELERFCEFSGVACTSGRLAWVAQQASFTVMRQKERRQGWDHPTWPKASAFVRRGQQGSYRDEMPGDVLDAFMMEAGPTLRRCGYA